MIEERHMMKFLDREQYNKLIAELNSDNNKCDSVQKLLDFYNNLLCKLADYEEIILLLNICIAHERENNFEKLHEHYSKIAKILCEYNGMKLKDDYNIYYCMGVFSFKFHDYERAQEYFKNCKNCMCSEGDPLENKKLKDIYIRTMILMSYTKEYSDIGRGSKDAICNILDENNLVEDLDCFEISEAKPKEAIKLFFGKNRSKIYEAANEPMKKEIIHVLSHCFSEYSVWLNKKEQGEPKVIFLWETLAEKFISFLGDQMITCEAIIQAEHGHYRQALDKMEKCYAELPNDKEKEKAELAFYIYYFNNQIDINTGIKIYKDFFINYAKKQNNRDTEVYAWIVTFRENFAEALSDSKESISKLIELEKECREIERLNQKYSYIHPQILEEERRLLLAYQIIRSYLQINAKNDDIDNDLFEKCILFNKKNKSKCRNNDSNAHNEVKNKADVFIELQGVNLCIDNITDEICRMLEKEFCAEIIYLDEALMVRQKIIIYDPQKKLEEYEEVVDSDMTYFIYCGEEDADELKESLDKSVYIGTDLITTIKIAYIQETLDKCYMCANKWEEFFVMAPITDNSTFAFQNQSIENYIKLDNDNKMDSNLFLDDNYEYVISDYGKLSCINGLEYKIRMNKEGVGNWRLYFYYKQWLYHYENGYLIPFKQLDSVKRIKKYLVKGRLQTYTRKTYRKTRECGCQHISNCLCDEWRIDDSAKREKILNLLMSLSIGKPQSEEKYLTLIFSEKVSEDRPLGNLFIILSDQSVYNRSLRDDLDTLGDLCKKWREMARKVGEKDRDGADDNKDEERMKVKKKNDALIAEVKEYIEENKHYMINGQSSESQIFFKKLQENCESITREKYNEFKEEWEHIRARI